jgi:hypothetical protein
MKKNSKLPAHTTPKGKKHLPDDFVSVARRLGADESKERFEAKLKKIAKTKPRQQGLLGITSREPCYHAALLPKLNVMAVNMLLGGINGCGIVGAIQIYGFCEVAVSADNVGSVIGHDARLRSGREHNTLGHR